MQPELFFFRWSHYNEKARWALDHKGISYVPHMLLPGKHMELARRLTGQTMVPILVLEGKAIADSTRIIAALEDAFPNKPLYPRDPAQRRRALELEEFFDEELGPYLRRIIVAACLPYTVYMAHLFDSEAPFVSRWVYRGVMRLVKKRFAQRMKTDAASVAHAWQKVEAAVTRLETEIQPSGYLVGNAFSVADLTAAAMLSIAVLPPQFPCLPRKTRPAPVQAVSERIQHRQAWHWVRDIYERHRGATAEVPVRATPILSTHQKTALP